MFQREVIKNSAVTKNISVFAIIIIARSRAWGKSEKQPGQLVAVFSCYGNRAPLSAGLVRGNDKKAQYVVFVNVMTQNVVKMFLHSEGYVL